MRAELRAALAVARANLIGFSRYRLAMAGLVFTPLYQGVVPAFLFGLSFAVGGRVLGLGSLIGSENLAGFIFLGGVVSGVVAHAFWGVAMGLRQEMDMGTLEATWVTPTSASTIVLGKSLGVVATFVASQIALFAIGFAFFGLQLDGAMVLALPAFLIAIVALAGVAYLVAAAVLLMREANFFVDTTSFLFSVMSGSAFPITVLPLVLQPVALLLPTTYAVDILRQHAIGARPLFDPWLEYAALLATAALFVPAGRWAFAWTERRLRVTGALAQH